MAPKPSQIDPYLTFDGDCAEAMRFYERVLGGRIEMMMTIGESPMAASAPPDAAGRILHASLAVAGRTIMGADAMPGQPPAARQGFSISLSYATAADGQQVFAALAEGGQVSMPLQDTFWAEGFGMLVDRFGTPWMVNAGPKNPG